MTTTTTKNKEKKVRVILDFDQVYIKKLDNLKRECGLRTRTALVNRALKLLSETVDRQNDGCKIMFVKDKESIEVVLL